MNRREYIEELFNQNPDETITTKQIKGALATTFGTYPYSCQVFQIINSLLSRNVITRTGHGRYQAVV